MTDELIGISIAGYDIQRLIGRGGMARVYLARQRSMNRLVALKVLPREFLSDSTYMRRFEKEVRIIATLEHRNIVPVYDYGQLQGLPFIAMRYMPAGSMDDLLAEGPLPPRQALAIISQIGPALDYANSKGVLHRDLKPSNILMDDDGGAFITDFGIARVLGDQEPPVTTRGVVGTPSYMSPEQAQGFELDGRSDVYALGIMLFEMLAGQRPFDAEKAYDIAVMQVTAQAPVLRSINPRLAEALEPVLARALEKDRQQRYQTATALVTALRTAVQQSDDGYEALPQPATPGYAGSSPTPRSQLIRPVPKLSPDTPRSSQPRRISPEPERQHPRRALVGALGCGLLLLIILGAVVATGGGVLGTMQPTATEPMIQLEDVDVNVPTLLP